MSRGCRSRVVRVLVLVVCLGWTRGGIAAVRVLTAQLTPRGPYTIGDRVVFQVRLLAPSDAGRPLVLAAPAGPVEWGAADVRADERSGVWIVRIPFQIFQVGRVSVAPPPLRIGDEELMLEPFTVVIRSVRTGPDADLLRDLKPPLRLYRRRWWPLLLGAVALGLAGWGSVLWSRRGRRSAPAPTVAPTPEEWLEEQLARLAERTPGDAEQLRAYLAAVAEVVREYLARRLRLAAPRMTTAETLARLRNHLPEGLLTELKEILTGADYAKFAKQTPETFQPRAYLARVEAVCRQIAQIAGHPDPKRPTANPERLSQGRSSP